MTPLAWGRAVAPAFRDRVRAIADGLGSDPNWLMACMAVESAGTFSPSVRNGAGSGVVGLIQFMPQTAGQLQTTTGKLAAMTAVEQLDYVHLDSAPGAAGCINSATLHADPLALRSRQAE